MKTYAGLGCKDVSEGAEGVITQVAKGMYQSGYNLRTGSNTGAQKAFVKGAGKYDIVNPFQYNISQYAFDLAQGNAPRWSTLSQPMKKVLASQAHIILGDNLDTPVQLVLMWENNDDSDAARFVRRLAASYYIPVYNLSGYGVMEIMQALGGE